MRDIHNKITPGDFTRAVQNLIKAGYQPKDIETYVIMGLPNQPIEEVIDTILYAHELGVQVRLSVFSPIPGTKDYDRAIEDRYFPADSDPLLTNKTIVPLFRTREAYHRFHTIAQYSHKLNEGLRKGASILSANEFRRKVLSISKEISSEETANSMLI